MPHDRPSVSRGARPSADDEAPASSFDPIDVSGSSFARLSSEEVMRKGRIGDAYIKTNRLTREEVDQIVALQKRLHIRFGEAAVRLGLLTEEEVHEVIAKQFNYASFGAKSKLARISASLAIVHAPQSEAAEAIKKLRAEILVRLEEEPSVAIAMISPVKGEGKSHIAASLAVAFAQANIPTMLIDANLRAPVQHLLFGIQNQTGLSTILAKRSARSLEAIPEILPGFWVLNSGPLPPNPIEMLSPPKLVDLLDHFAPQIRMFVIDTPAATAWADAQTIARQAGRALIVARENLTKLADLKAARADMESAGVDVLGTVYNRPPQRDQQGWRALLRWLSAPLAALGRIMSRRQG